jgi:hypothetical protein
VVSWGRKDIKMIEKLINLHLSGVLKFQGKKTKIRIISTLSDGGYVFQVFKSHHRGLLYQGSDESRVAEVFLEHENKH